MVMRVEIRWWEMGVADGGAVRLSVYEGGGASGGGLSVGEGLEDMACEVSCVCLLFAGVPCSKYKYEDGNCGRSVLVEVGNCSSGLLHCRGRR